MVVGDRADFYIGPILSDRYISIWYNLSQTVNLYTMLGLQGY